MKESELIEIKRKTEALTRVVEFLVKELDQVKTLSVGTYQTVKNMPGFKESVSILTELSKKKDNEEVEKKLE